ncbi:MAG: GTP-binding protein SAR1a [Paramarteilia canceri]
MASALLNWFSGIFQYFGSFFKEGTEILFLGLDNAGKTTLLGKLDKSKLIASDPTLKPTRHELHVNNVKFITTDVGGHIEARKVWKDYYMFTKGILFIIDAADRRRFTEAKHELMQILNESSVQNVPIAILANKIDIRNSASEEEICNVLQIGQLRTGKEIKASGSAKEANGIRPLEIFMCSLIKDQGFVEPFRWLAGHTN